MVYPARFQNAPNLPEHLCSVRNEVYGVRVPYDVESVFLEAGQVSHVAVDGLYVQPVVASGFTVAFKLGFGQIQRGHVRSEQPEGGGLLTSASRQAEYPLAADGAYQAFGVNQRPRRAFVHVQEWDGVFYPRLCQRLPSLLVESG